MGELYCENCNDLVPYITKSKYVTEAYRNRNISYFKFHEECGHCHAKLWSAPSHDINLKRVYAALGPRHPTVTEYGKHISYHYVALGLKDSKQELNNSRCDAEYIAALLNHLKYIGKLHIAINSLDYEETAAALLQSVSDRYSGCFLSFNVLPKSVNLVSYLNATGVLCVSFLIHNKEEFIFLKENILLMCTYVPIRILIEWSSSVGSEAELMDLVNLISVSGYTAVIVPTIDTSLPLQSLIPIAVHEDYLTYSSDNVVFFVLQPYHSSQNTMTNEYLSKQVFVTTPTGNYLGWPKSDMSIGIQDIFSGLY